MDSDTEVTLKIDQDTQSIQVVEPEDKEEHSEKDVKLEIEQVEDTKSNVETEDDEWYDAPEEIVEK